jgi:type I restriction enzyme S subunit
LKRAALASHGIGRLRINLGEMRALPLPLPPAREQRRIVAKLETLFEQTRAAKARLGRLPALLERFKCSILAAAVRGELTADWRAAHPEVEPASALLDRIRTGRRCRWEDGLRAKGKDPSKATYEDPAGVDMDALPPLPHGWTWASVEQLISEPMCNGISIPGSDTPPGTRSLKLNALTEGGIDFSAVRFIAIDEDTVEQLRLRPGDFLVSRGNGSRHLVGRAVAVDAIPPTPTVYPDTIIRVRFGPALDDTGWIPAIWSSPDIRRQIEARAKTTAGIYKISQNDLGSIRVPLPSVEEQRVVAQRVATAMTSLRTLLATCDGQAERVARLEQAILARAFRGELIPQDPTDEPAAVVLDRIRAARAAEPESPRRARRRETWTKDSA